MLTPDPVLTGVAMAETIKGIQDAGVIACAKHFIGYEQEHFRQVSEALGFGYNITDTISSNIDDRTLHELYLWPFADAVRAGVGSIMCSYNQINNSYACSNAYLQNYILKGELGFQGFVMSDWGAHHGGVNTALAGLDMSMPGDALFGSGTSFWGSNLTLAVLNGSVPEWRIDDMATRILTSWYYVGRDNNTIPINFSSWTTDTFGWLHDLVGEGYGLVNQHVDVRGEHANDIRNMAARGTVLLKNVKNTLPLTGKEKFTAVFGEDAADSRFGPNGCSDRGCDNGTLGMAWGSGSAGFPYLVTPLTAIQNEVLRNQGIIQSVTDNWDADSQILQLARQATHAIVFVNSDSGEGYLSVDGNEGDRQNLTLWQNGENLIKNVTSQCNNTIVVLHSTGPVLVDSWVHNPNITALVWAGVPGQESGNSIADILYGRVNPAARLPFTMAATREDYGTDLLYWPNNGEKAPQSEFTEGVFIDYRALDRAAIDPVYEFGFGLSYTNFTYSNLQIAKHLVGNYTPNSGVTAPAPVLGNYSTKLSDYLFPANFSKTTAYLYPNVNTTDAVKDYGWTDYGNSDFIPKGARDGSPQPVNPAGGAPGGNPKLYDVLYTVNATITNTGGRDGEEVPQLYISLGSPTDPKVVLRGFERLSIDQGQSTTFSVDITRRDLSNWDVVSQNWVVSNYTKTVFVGPSSRNLPLSAKLY
ncbi:MAG: hypothetical protein M1819_006158 [Sarea resinae]|nr:MAG: hypothetical protein M1819_006158 [Sarea resinae]